MKVMSTWSAQPGALKTAVQRFLSGQGQPAAGVTLLGRWHRTDFSGGFALYETDNPAALHETAGAWADLLVIEDALGYRRCRSSSGPGKDIRQIDRAK